MERSAATMRFVLRARLPKKEATTSECFSWETPRPAPSAATPSRRAFTTSTECSVRWRSSRCRSPCAEAAWTRAASRPTNSWKGLSGALSTSSRIGQRGRRRSLSSDRGVARAENGRSKTALVLGGGVGGVVAANRLRERLPREHHVVLVDREAQHLFQPSLLWLAVGDREPHRIQRPLERLRRKGIDVIRGEISKINAESRTITIDGREITGDAMIVSLGAELAPEAIP